MPGNNIIGGIKPFFATEIAEKKITQIQFCLKSDRKRGQYA